MAAIHSPPLSRLVAMNELHGDDWHCNHVKWPSTEISAFKNCEEKSLGMNHIQRIVKYELSVWTQGEGKSHFWDGCLFNFQSDIYKYLQVQDQIQKGEGREGLALSLQRFKLIKAVFSHFRVTINIANRTEWSPLRSVIIRVIWLQTELNDTKSCYQLIIIIPISVLSFKFLILEKAPALKGKLLSCCSDCNLWTLWLVDLAEST